MQIALSMMKRMITIKISNKTQKNSGGPLYQSSGASDGNRTRILTLARLRSTTELHLQFATGIAKSLDYYSKINTLCNIISTEKFKR